MRHRNEIKMVTQMKNTAMWWCLPNEKCDRNWILKKIVTTERKKCHVGSLHDKIDCFALIKFYLVEIVKTWLSISSSLCFLFPKSHYKCIQSLYYNWLAFSIELQQKNTQQFLFAAWKLPATYFFSFQRLIHIANILSQYHWKYRRMIKFKWQ